MRTAISRLEPTKNTNTHTTMNFNKGAGNPGQGAQQFAGRQRPNAMLPPQFQHFTPQQLQELENNPQFQNTMRQFYQNKMLQQQQALLRQQQQAGLSQGMGQMAGQPNQNLAQTPNQRMMNRNIPSGYMPQNQQAQQQLQAQRAGHQVLAQGQPMGGPQGHVQMGGNGIPGGMNNPAAAAAAAAVAAASLSNYNNVQKFGGQFPPQGASAPGQMPMGCQPGQARNSLYGAMGGIPGPSSAAAMGGNPAASSMNSMLTIPGPMAGAVPARGATGPQQSSKTLRFGNTEEPEYPPGFGPDSLAKLPLKQLSSLDEWSQKLAEEGKEVPLDIKIYEDIIKKDSSYLRGSQQQSKKNKTMIEKMARDIKTYNTIKQLRMNAINASDKNQYNNSIWGEGYLGYGNGISNTATQVILPQNNKPFSRVPDIGYTEKQLNEAVLRGLKTGKNKPLVPIRLDFDQERDRFKLRDTFLWDLSDETYRIENFVRTLIEDYKFIPDQHFHSIMNTVNEQIKDFKPIVDNPMGELRVPIKIDLVINNTQFTDQFEWDILSLSENDPEEFATILCDEMSLPGEFVTAIAFSIREQAQLFHKALFLVGYSFDGSLVREDEIRSHLLPPLRVLTNSEAGEQVEDFITTLRNPAAVSDFSPALNKLTQLEVEKIDKEMERESRRRRRHNNDFSYNENGPNMGVNRGTASRRSGLHIGRGVKTTLPDLSEIPKMFRTPMPSSILPGGIDLGVPEIYGYNELIVNRTQIRNPDYKPPNAELVTYARDGGSFFVKIKMPRRYH